MCGKASPFRESPNIRAATPPISSTRISGGVAAKNSRGAFGKAELSAHQAAKPQETKATETVPLIFAFTVFGFNI